MAVKNPATNPRVNLGDRPAAARRRLHEDDELGGVGTRSWQLIRNHPVPVAVVGATVGWLIYESTAGIGPRRQLRRVSRLARSQWRNGRGRLRRLFRRSQNRVANGTRTVQKAAGRTAAQAVSLGAELRRNIAERPLTAGLATLGVGLLVGWLIPSTRFEDDWMGDTREDFVRRAQRDARASLHKGRDVARAAVDHLREQAAAEGLTPEELGERARRVSRGVSEAVRRDAEEAFSDELPLTDEDSGYSDPFDS
jgi:hypothetical protein